MSFRQFAYIEIHIQRLSLKIRGKMCVPIARRTTWQPTALSFKQFVYTKIRIQVHSNRIRVQGWEFQPVCIDYNSHPWTSVVIFLGGWAQIHDLSFQCYMPDQRSDQPATRCGQVCLMSETCDLWPLAQYIISNNNTITRHNTITRNKDNSYTTIQNTQLQPQTCTRATTTTTTTSSRTSINKTTNTWTQFPVWPGLSLSGKGRSIEPCLAPGRYPSCAIASTASRSVAWRLHRQKIWTTCWDAFWASAASP